MCNDHWGIINTKYLLTSATCQIPYQLLNIYIQPALVEITLGYYTGVLKLYFTSWQKYNVDGIVAQILFLWACDKKLYFYILSIKYKNIYGVTQSVKENYVSDQANSSSMRSLQILSRIIILVTQYLTDNIKLTVHIFSFPGDVKKQFLPS